MKKKRNKIRECEDTRMQESLIETWLTLPCSLGQSDLRNCRYTYICVYTGYPSCRPLGQNDPACITPNPATADLWVKTTQHVYSPNCAVDVLGSKGPRAYLSKPRCWRHGVKTTPRASPQTLLPKPRGPRWTQRFQKTDPFYGRRRESIGEMKTRSICKTAYAAADSFSPFLDDHEKKGTPESLGSTRLGSAEIARKTFSGPSRKNTSRMHEPRGPPDDWYGTRTHFILRKKVLILFRYHTLTSPRAYSQGMRHFSLSPISVSSSATSLWEAESSRSIFRATMPLKRSHSYSRLLRFDDRETRDKRCTTDQLAAVREVWDAWVERLPLLYNPGPEVTVDEQLVCLWRKMCTN